MYVLDTALDIMKYQALEQLKALKKFYMRKNTLYIFIFIFWLMSNLCFAQSENIFLKMFAYDNQKEWDWQVISDGNWISKKTIKKSKYDIADVWIKREIRERAKELGVSYKDTVVNISYDCKDKNYRIIFFVDRYSDNISRSPPLMREGQWRNISLSNNQALHVSIYSYVCKN